MKQEAKSNERTFMFRNFRNQTETLVLVSSP